MDVLWFGKGLLFGLAMAAPVGPMAILCVQRSLNRGWKAGLATGLGIASGDGVYAVLAATGWFLAAARVPALQFGFRVAGGCGLVWLGLSVFRKAAAHLGPAKDRTGRGDWLSAFFLTLTNPATVLIFAAFISSLTLPPGTGTSAPSELVLGIFSGSALWWFCLSGLTAALRRKISANVMKWINRVSAVMLLGFGIWILINLGVHP